MVASHNLRNVLIRLPAIRCEFREMNEKYQMQSRLSDLASLANPPGLCSSVRLFGRLSEGI